MADGNRHNARVNDDPNSRISDRLGPYGDVAALEDPARPKENSLTRDPSYLTAAAPKQQYQYPGCQM